MSIPIRALRVLCSGSLTRFQLIQIPPTNRQIPLILVQALTEVRHILLANPGGLVALVHGVLPGLVLGGDRLLLGGLGGCGATAPKEPPNGVPDR